jgi:hypothetical protein
MANFRGLTYLFFRRDQSPWAVAIVSIVSAWALAKTVAYWRRARLTANRGFVALGPGEFDLAFANAVLFALLVSYHLNPHDLSLLLLPISLLLHYALARSSRGLNPRDWAALGLLAILFLPPLHVWALKAGVYALIALPVFLLFLICTPVIPRESSTSSAVE